MCILCPCVGLAPTWKFVCLSVFFCGAKFPGKHILSLERYKEISQIVPYQSISTYLGLSVTELRQYFHTPASPLITITRCFPGFSLFLFFSSLLSVSDNHLDSCMVRISKENIAEVTFSWKSIVWLLPACVRVCSFANKPAMLNQQKM